MRKNLERQRGIVHRNFPQVVYSLNEKTETSKNNYNNV